MAHYENITAGSGAIDSFANALNSQRFANLMLNETISNFSNNITRAGALYDEARIREDILKYQRMQDFYNNKRKDEAFELEKKQAELNMDSTKRLQIINDLKAQGLKLANQQQQEEFRWLMKAIPHAKVSALVGNSAMKTTTTPTAPNPLKTPTTQTPKTITKEKFQALYANPFFKY
ncbi:hypothetical protein [Helicobacter pylori]|uniref:hypothetical protein n=1 Tax=Helicobacter pylori TaxID=210 RepID=UPI000D3317CE|nr:hypothetical protein [Helicobacter pylori]PUD06506.1 hypothetical protein C2R85_07565 [Helicobacter pylori]